jgi:hypothetical protein
MAMLVLIMYLLIAIAIVVPIYKCVERAAIRRKIAAHKKIKQRNK